MSIIAIDPGTRNTGLVHMNEHRIIAATTLSFDKSVKVDQDALRRRAAEIASLVRAWVKGREFDAIVIEGFISFASRASAYVFQTPYLCGYLHATLRGHNIVIQTSTDVLNEKKPGNVAHIKQAMANKENVWPGCELCTNDHTRSAACHGIYYYARRNRAKALDL